MSFANLNDVLRFSPEKLTKNNVYSCPQMACDVYCVEPGQSQRVHAHAAEAKVYYVIEGQGDITVGDRTETMGPGQFAFAPAGVMHGLTNNAKERMIALVIIAPHPSKRASNA